MAFMFLVILICIVGIIAMNISRNAVSGFSRTSWPDDGMTSNSFPDVPPVSSPDFDNQSANLPIPPVMLDSAAPDSYAPAQVSESAPAAQPTILLENPDPPSFSAPSFTPDFSPPADIVSPPMDCSPSIPDSSPPSSSGGSADC